MSRDLAVEVGWVKTKSKNRWLLWSDQIGRMMWFETRRVNIYVRGSATLGRIKQLISNGFFNTGLISELKVLEQVFKIFKFKGAHYVFNAGQSLPRMNIEAFERSHGIRIKIGDKSHPRGVEVISRCPDWAERIEQLFERLSDLLLVDSNVKEAPKKLDYVT